MTFKKERHYAALEPFKATWPWGDNPDSHVGKSSNVFSFVGGLVW